jgi:hypothetical protein
MKRLKYYSKEIYGQTMYYFATADDRAMWRNISGKKTITKFDMNSITELTGVVFERVFEAES